MKPKKTWTTRGRRREATAMQPRRKKARIDDDDDGREKNRGEINAHPPARSRLWEQVVRIKSLLIPASLFAFAHRSLFLGRDDQQEEQQHQQSSSSAPRQKRKRVAEKQNDEHRDKYLDQVILSDCVEYVQNMPPGMLSCTITCPPSNTRAIENEDRGAWLEFVNAQLALLEQLYRVTKPGGHLWYVHKVQHYKNNVFHPVTWVRKSPWQIRQEIVWDTMETPEKSNQKFWPIDRRIFWLRKEPGPRFCLHPLAFKWGNIWRWKFSDHSFPIFLALAILHASNLSKGSLVFDPYGRLGTTAKACQMLKHHFLVTEKDESKLKAINQRLNETTHEDKFWKSLAWKQITNGTLNLNIPPESSFPK